MFTSGWVWADSLRTVYNPFTQKLDYVNVSTQSATYASLPSTQTWSGGNTFVGSTTFRGALAYTGQTAYSIPYLNLNKTLTSSIFFTIYAPGSGGTHGIDMNTNGLTGGFSAIGAPVVNSTHTAIDISLDGSNIPFSETAVSGVVAGTGVHNIAGRFSASGGTTNVGLDVTGQEVLAGSMTVTQGIVTSTMTVTDFLQLASKTVAQFAATAPGAADKVFACSDCTALKICISTGSAQGAWSSPVSKTTPCN